MDQVRFAYETIAIREGQSILPDNILSREEAYDIIYIWLHDNVSRVVS